MQKQKGSKEKWLKPILQLTYHRCVCVDTNTIVSQRKFAKLNLKVENIRCGKGVICRWCFWGRPAASPFHPYWTKAWKSDGVPLSLSFALSLVVFLLAFGANWIYNCTLIQFNSNLWPTSNNIQVLDSCHAGARLQFGLLAFLPSSTLFLFLCHNYFNYKDQIRNVYVWK